MEKQAKYIIKPEIAWRKMKDGTLTIIHPVTEKIITVNHTAAIIWEELEAAASPEQIIEKMQARFPDISPGRIADEVSSVIHDFIARSLIEKQG